ncbi:MAG: hypothetical protein ACRDT0_05160 [Pseudonocardiaceae bacterium]
MTSTFDPDRVHRYDPPEVVALCREDEDGREELAGWMMLLPDANVVYVPDRDGDSPLVNAFSSLATATLLLDYAGIYLAGEGEFAASAPSVLP